MRIQHNSLSITRRSLLQLGLALGGLWPERRLWCGQSQPVVTQRPIRACILIFYYGGPSHIDTWDMKPDAPKEVRGSFQPIATSVPGLQICEHLPRMARVMDKVAIIRSVHHTATLHDSASIHALTGRPLDGPDRELFAPLPQFYPSFGSAVAYTQRQSECEVPFASLPYVFQNVVPTPCQGGGFLGNAYDPLCVDVDPTAKGYRVESLRPREGVDAARLNQRWNLLQAINQPSRVPEPLSRYYGKAYRLLESERLRKALDISQESTKTRDRYGYGTAPVVEGESNPGGGAVGFAREMRGQNLLLARRLIEAGVPFVNVYDYKQQGLNWDAHSNCASQHKNYLLPQADQALSALIEDLHERDLLESTLVVATGEFGRTPKINANAGRDHWPHCYSVVLAGGGVCGGAVWGASDKHGAYPSLDPVTPGDIAATIYWRFGVDHASTVHDSLGRPHRLAIGEPIKGIFA